jgi:riboflavin synthase
MFTGLIEEVGRVLSHESQRLVVGARTLLPDASVGASIAVNGVCLTVVERGAEELRFDLGPETCARTALTDVGPGEGVNLERPLRLGGLVGGHLVQGHVDGVGVVVAMTRAGGTARLRLRCPDEALAALLIPQGSVAVDGVSLTVAALDPRGFEIMLIPHTLAETTLGSLTQGRRVNLEMDMIGKYVQSFLARRGAHRRGSAERIARRSERR